MDTRIATVITGLGGVASASRLQRTGVAPREITRALRTGQLVRVRRNALVDGALWHAALPWERHALRARAVAATLPADSALVLSHHSALAVWGVPLHDVDDRVHLTATDGRRGRTDARVSFHRPVPPPFVTRHEGIAVVRPAAACVQVAALAGGEAGLVSADGALRARRCTTEELHAALTALGAARSSRVPAQVVRLADPRIESAAESRARWVFGLAGIPQPTPQVEIRDEGGRFVARVDFLLEEYGVVIEVDGMAKYEDVRDLRAEKVREDRLRELGHEVVRLTWAELADPVTVQRKVLAAVSRSRARARVTASGPPGT
ncbi:hypothetical protein [Janibacter sp. GS2]|uniref:hypothetical protein n=1 Tax=Janibacter sp. GS2 TaxID=3442646 RepID=UPI003EB7D46E